MTESSSTPIIEKEDSCSNLSDSQISLLDECVESATTSTPQSTDTNNINFEQLRNKLVKEIVKNAILQTNVDKNEKEIKTLKNDLKKSNDMNNALNKIIDDLAKLNNTVVFMSLTNKWKANIYNTFNTCCEKVCLNAFNPFGYCFNGNGYFQIINGNILKYNLCLKWKGVNKYATVLSEFPFNKPLNNCSTYSLFYFEIKCQMEAEKNSLENWIVIGLNNKNYSVRLRVHESKILNKINYIDNQFSLNKFIWNDSDIFGCGLVYPPTNLAEKFPYIFFTQNGMKIGKAVLLKENYNFFFPYVYLKCCSVETNWK